MRDALREVERRHDGLFLEDKGLSLALHYRQVPKLGTLVLREVSTLFRQMGPGFHLQTGKCLIEVVPLGNTKGTVVAEFMTEEPFRGRVPAFLGDDVTDESAFAVVNDLGGVSIKVGVGPTHARYRLIDVMAVRSWLASLRTLTMVSNTDAGDAA